MERDATRRSLQLEHESLARVAAWADDHQRDADADLGEIETEATIERIAVERLADVEDAIERVERADYGRCETCGVAIDEERLAARPEARFCDVHQRIWELSCVAMDLGGLPPDGPEDEEPGWAELALMPEDPDELDADGRDELAPEEAALHVEEVGEEGVLR